MLYLYSLKKILLLWYGNEKNKIKKLYEKEKEWKTERVLADCMDFGWVNIAFPFEWKKNEESDDGFFFSIWFVGGKDWNGFKVKLLVWYILALYLYIDLIRI